MDDEIDSLVLSIRADTRGFATDVGAMRAQMDGPLTQGVGAAGVAIGSALGRATKLGAGGFGDLRTAALRTLGDIAAASLKLDLGGLTGQQGGGLGPLLGGALSALGLPGRAAGGPVAAGRPYLVGERGPELFVPGPGGGRVQAVAGGGATTITVNVAASADASRSYMAKTGNQVALSVRRALDAGGSR